MTAFGTKRISSAAKSWRRRNAGGSSSITASVPPLGHWPCCGSRAGEPAARECASRVRRRPSRGSPNRRAAADRTRARAGSTCATSSPASSAATREAEVDAGGDAAAGDAVAIATTRSATGMAPNSGSRSRQAQCVGRLVAVEQAGGAEQQRAGAHRGDVARPRRLPAQEVEHLGIAHQRDLAAAAGHEDHVERRAVGEASWSARSRSRRRRAPARASSTPGAPWRRARGAAPRTARCSRAA